MHGSTVSMQRSEAQRAALSQGRSSSIIHEKAAEIVARRGAGGVVVDVGCGAGAFLGALPRPLERYIGCDLVAYDGFPDDPRASFVEADLNHAPFPIADGSADVVVAIETIEHLENPRAFVRELARIVRRGGLIVVTTPNQLSLLSKLTLVVKNQFNAFQESSGLYPAHITALVEADLRHIAAECGLEGIEVTYTDQGRMPLGKAHWPRWLGFRGRWFSDNVILSCIRTA